MKQEVTLEQLNELSEKSREKLYEWALDHNYTEEGVDFTPTIGQMIEFLAEKKCFAISSIFELNDYSLWTDCLWELIKNEIKK